MSKLNQIVAVVNGKKTTAEKEKTELYHKLKQLTLFEGLARKYSPKDEDGETFPPETKVLQMKVDDAIEEFGRIMSDMIDVVATQDWGNCEAKADVVVRGVTLMEQVPVTHLLFLEKQLQDLSTFVSHLPVLNPTEEWHYDENKSAFVTDTQRSNKTKKVYKNHVKAEATDKHPAQVEVYTEDVVVGTWDTIKFSGGVPSDVKKKYGLKVRELQDAVKYARENANNTEVKQLHVAKPLFDFVFKK